MACLVISIILLLIMAATKRLSTRESIVSLVEKLQAIAGGAFNFREVYARDFPEELTVRYDRAQQELENIGFVRMADVVYSSIDNFAWMTGKTFMRLMHNRDYTVWAAIFIPNPPWLSRVFTRALGGSGFLEGMTELNVSFSDETSLEVSSRKVPVGPRRPECLRCVALPGASAMALAERMGKEILEKTGNGSGVEIVPHRTLRDVSQAIRRSELMISTYMLQHQVPGVEELRAYGANDEVIREYRAICEQVADEKKRRVS